MTVSLLATPSSAVEDAPAVSADDAALSLAPLGTYRSGVFDESAAEIVAFHAATERTFVVNAESGRLDVLDASDPTDPTLVTSLAVAGTEARDGSTIPADAAVNSVDVRPDGLLVLAVESDPKTDAGWLAFADAQALDVLGAVRVGALPDMVELTADGRRAVVANEGEPADDFSSDPAGSVGVVDLPASVAVPTQAAARTADFEAWDPGGSRELPDGVRVFGPVLDPERRVSTNLEPEYVALDADGTTAYVALQEANAVAVVDLESAEVRDLWSLGWKDHAAVGQGLDPSDRDDAVAIGPWPVRGLYLPDGLSSYSSGGSTYLVSANEGDAREWGDYVEPARVKDLGDDGLPPICEDSPLADLTADDQLGRLNVTTADGLSDDGSCYEELYSFGTRSFSIWTTDGQRVFDSGEALEQVTAEAAPEFFNSNHSESNREGRSDDKGPEPENLAIGEVDGRTYAFVGLERVGGVAVFDISSPGDSAFVTYLNNRDFSVSVEDADDPAAVLDAAGDLGPEGLTFVGGDDSPTGDPMLVVGNEVSGTTTFYDVALADGPGDGDGDGDGDGEAELALDLDARSVPAGGTLSGDVSGARPDETLTLTLFSDPVDLGSTTAGDDGTAPFSVTVPASVPPGEHTVRATGPSGVAEATVVVTAASVDGPGTGAVGDDAGGALPDAGTPVNAWLVALGLIAVALGSTVLGGTALRRRRAPDQLG